MLSKEAVTEIRILSKRGMRVRAIARELGLARDLERSRRGYRLNGRTPAQALHETLGRKRLPPIVPKAATEQPEEAVA